jgi:hypothetical protein
VCEALLGEVGSEALIGTLRPDTALRSIASTEPERTELADVGFEPLLGSHGLRRTVGCEGLLGEVGPEPVFGTVGLPALIGTVGPEAPLGTVGTETQIGKLGCNSRPRLRLYVGLGTSGEVPSLTKRLCLSKDCIAANIGCGIGIGRGTFFMLDGGMA